MDNEEPILWHEQILDEYWNKLEAKIDNPNLDDAGYCRKNWMHWNTERISLAAFVSIIRSGRATNSSTFVNFVNANLCGEGIVSLSKLEDGSSELQRFYLIRNRIDGMESARCLSRSLKTHARITELHLTHCDLGSSQEILLVILQSDNSFIDLRHNSTL